VVALRRRVASTARDGVGVCEANPPYERPHCGAWRRDLRPLPRHHQSAWRRVHHPGGRVRGGLRPTATPLRRTLRGQHWPPQRQLRACEPSSPRVRPAPLAPPHHLLDAQRGVRQRATSVICTDPPIDPRNCGGCGPSAPCPAHRRHGCNASECSVGVPACATGLSASFYCDVVASNGCNRPLSPHALRLRCGRSCPRQRDVAAPRAWCTVTACAETFANCDAAAGQRLRGQPRDRPRQLRIVRHACGLVRVLGGACGTACLLPTTCPRHGRRAATNC